MCTKTKIALSVAIALGSAFLSLSTYAFAGNVYDSPEWAAPLYGWEFCRHSAVGNFGSNAHGPAPGARGELNAIRQPNATRRRY
jgi:hypothetical protein